MQLMNCGIKPDSRKLIACMVALVMFFSILGLGSPGTAWAKTEESDPAEFLVVNILNPDGTTTLVHEYSYEELEPLEEIEYYATIDALPIGVGTKAKGVKIHTLIEHAVENYDSNIKWGSGQKLVFYVTDYPTVPYQGTNYYTYDFLYGQERCYFPKLVETYDPEWGREDIELDGAVAVAPMLASSSYQERWATDEILKSTDNPVEMDGTESFRFCMGITEAEALDENFSSTNKFARWVYRVDVGPVNGERLTADKTDNEVGQPIEITFKNNSTWQTAITQVRVNEDILDPDKYEITAGEITIKPGVFTEAGTYAITVEATGFMNSTVKQKINEATKPTTVEVEYTAEGDITAISPEGVTFAYGKFTVLTEVTEFTFKDADKEMKATFAEGTWTFAEVVTEPTTYTVTFTVTDSENAAIPGVEITIAEQTLTTDANGEATIDLENGTYIYGVTAEGFGSITDGEVVVSGSAAAVAVTMTGEIPQGDFAFDENTKTITGYTGSGGDVVIPLTINGVQVEHIGSDAFYNCSSLTSVTIPDSVTSIGEAAFESCTGLTSVTIPNSVTNIERKAFYECSSLTSITIPDSVESIGDCAFMGCTVLTSITMGRAGIEIGDNLIGDGKFNEAYAAGGAGTYILLETGEWEIVKEPSEVPYTATGDITAITPDTVTFADGKFTVPAGVTEFTFKDGGEEMKATFAEEEWTITEVVTPEPTTYTVTFEVTPEGPTVVVKKGEDVVAAEADGTYKLEAGEYSYTISKEGYVTKTSTITVSDKDETVTVALEEVITEPETVEVAYAAEGEITEINPETVTFADGKFTVSAGVTEFTFKDADKEMKATFAEEEWTITEVQASVAKLESITVTTLPTKTIYIVDEELDLTGLVVTGTYDDKSTKTIEVTKDMISGFNSSKLGNQTLTIAVGDKSTTYVVTITKPVEARKDESEPITIDSNIPVTITVPQEASGAKIKVEQEKPLPLVAVEAKTTEGKVTVKMTIQGTKLTKFPKLGWHITYRSKEKPSATVTKAQQVNAVIEVDYLMKK